MSLKTGLITASLFVLSVVFASSARADFSGQTILGPLGPGSIVGGDTNGSTNDNDGFSSGNHIFDIWPGRDDVWQLNWPGGDLTITMTGGATDLDLFLYFPGSYDDTATQSTGPDSNELIVAPGADPGIYYVVIDSIGDAAAYQLEISDVPEPTSLAGIALIAGALVRRRR